jgi:hypothetical protein
MWANCLLIPFVAALFPAPRAVGAEQTAANVEGSNKGIVDIEVAVDALNVSAPVGVPLSIHVARDFTGSIEPIERELEPFTSVSIDVEAPEDVLIDLEPALPDGAPDLAVDELVPDIPDLPDIDSEDDETTVINGTFEGGSREVGTNMVRSSGNDPSEGDDEAEEVESP